MTLILNEMKFSIQILGYNNQTNTISQVIFDLLVLI